MKKKKKEKFVMPSVEFVDEGLKLFDGIGGHNMPREGLPTRIKRFGPEPD